MQAARRGEWRVVGLMLDRVFGKPKETVAVQQEEPEIFKEMRAMTREQRRNLLRQWNDEDEEQAAGAGG
jgi:hypothetical protein